MPAAMQTQASGSPLWNLCTPERTARQHQHQIRKDKGDRSQRHRSKPSDIPGLDHADARVDEEPRCIRRGHAQQFRKDRPFDKLLGSMGDRSADGGTGVSGGWDIGICSVCGGDIVVAAITLQLIAVNQAPNPAAKGCTAAVLLR